VLVDADVPPLALDFSGEEDDVVVVQQLGIGLVAVEDGDLEIIAELTQPYMLVPARVLILLLDTKI
jgi:hypothetical protein